MVAPTVPSSSVACPFIAGPMITNPSLFIGRKELLQTMTTLMTGPQPTSINIVGERRIGKSSLLYHFYQTWEQRVALTTQYVVVSSLSDPIALLDLGQPLEPRQTTACYARRCGTGSTKSVRGRKHVFPRILAEPDFETTTSGNASRTRKTA